MKEEAVAVEITEMEDDESRVLSIMWSNGNKTEAKVTKDGIYLSVGAV